MISTTTAPRQEQRTVVPVFITPARWHQLGLGVTLVVAAALNSWQLAKEGYANSYYAATVKSMLQSWHNFFFVSFDPGGFVTVDKPPLGFWIQAASAKLFGFHGWSILLPQALAGVLSVFVLYHLVRRVFTSTAGLIAAFVLAVTPISVVTNRNNTIDSLLVLTVLLASWAVMQATATGRFRWLLLGMVLVGLGFNIKMLEAYLVLPALVLVYLFGAPHRLLKRVTHLAVSLVVLFVVSLSWATAVDLTPASARPYVGSTQNNSELSLALGYNGLQRLLGTTMGPQGGAPGNATRPDATTTQVADGVPQPTNGQQPDRAQAPVDGTAFPLPAGSGSFPGSAGISGSGGPGGSAPGNAGGPGGPGGGGPGGIGENGSKGILRLFDPQLGGQIAWLLPLALLGLVCTGGGLLLRSTRRRYDPEAAVLDPSPTLRAQIAGSAMDLLRGSADAQQQSVLLWGTWTLMMIAFFSVAGFFHRYYLSMLAPGIAALVGIGMVALWQFYRREHLLGWLLPLALIDTAAVQAAILATYPTYARWLTPIILAIATTASVILLIARLRHRAFSRGRLIIAAITMGFCALLIAPTTWAVVSVVNGGGSGLPVAGPTQQGAGFPGGFALPTGIDASAAVFPATGGPGGSPGAQTDTALLSYLEANRSTEKFLVAVPTTQSADAIILSTGDPVMAMGGFTGSDPILTPMSVAQLVDRGVVRYFLLGGSGPGDASSSTTSAAGWVAGQCTTVSRSVYQSSMSSDTPRGPAGSQQLYDCGHVAKAKG